MTLAQKQMIFWGGVLATLILALSTLGSTLSPFLAAFALAYILDPLVDRLARLGVPRIVGALFALLLSISFIVGLFLLLLPILFSQLNLLLEKLPLWLEGVRAVLEEFVPSLQEIIAKAPSLLSQTKGWLPEGFVGEVFSFLFAGGAEILSILSFLFITPIVATYILRDWDKITRFIDSLLPTKRADRLRALLTEVDTTLSASLRGLFFVCVSLAIFYATALHFLGLEFGILLGIFSGLISFIPYVALIFALPLTLQAAVFQFYPDWQWGVAISLGVFAVGQILETYIFTPYFVGDKVGVHIVWVIFALLVFGALWGFAGLLVALPAAAVMGVLVRNGIQTYRASDYYQR